MEGVPNQIKAWYHPFQPQLTEKTVANLKLIQIENAQTTMLLRFSLCKTMLQFFIMKINKEAFQKKKKNEKPGEWYELVSF